MEVCIVVILGYVFFFDFMVFFVVLLSGVVLVGGLLMCMGSDKVFVELDGVLLWWC